MDINIYLYLILDKLGLDNEHSFVNMIIKVHIFMFSWYKTFYRNTSTNMNILTNIHSGTLISIHEQEALVATFMYCYISILYSISCIPSMHFLPSLSPDDDETNILYQTTKINLYAFYSLVWEICIDKKNWGVMKLLWLNGSDTCYWHCRINQWNGMNHSI